MFSVRFVPIVILAFVSVAFSAPPKLGPGPVVFPVQYEEWASLAPLGCKGPSSNEGSSIVGKCFDFAAPAHSVKLTPHPPADASCSVQFWDASGCTGAASEITPLANGVQSGCIVPVFAGEFHSLKPPAGVSAKVTCTFNNN